jgi:hypothetical protein
MPRSDLQAREARPRGFFQNYNYNYNNRSRRPGIGAAQRIALALAGDDTLCGAADIAFGIGVEAGDRFEPAMQLEG